MTWGNRRESSRDCATHWRKWLVGLSELDNSLANWCELGRSKRKAAEKKLDFHDLDEIERLLLSGRNRRDTDQSVIMELGFSLRLWNAMPENESSQVFGTCGLFGSTPSIPLQNTAGLSLPIGGEALCRLSRFDTLLRLISLGVSVWDPEYATVSSSLPARIDEGGSVKAGSAIWMHYFPVTGVAISDLPNNLRVEPVLDRGSLVVAVDGDFNIGDPRKMEAASAAVELVKATGLLESR